ncbi:MAG: tetratricopeptide repeat protein [Thermodesulfovibrionales bacterium]|nr:tetratricopeptide repeat protein [Thermodesulfovibrionales bacterium]
MTLGLSYLNENNYQMAYIQFQKAYGIEPKNKDVLNSLGLIYLYFGDFEKAKRYFNEAIQIDTNFSAAYNNLGTLYARMSKWDEAIEYFKRALSNPLYENPENAYFNLGNAYYRVGKYELSITAYLSSLKRDSSFTPSLYGLALAYNRLGRYGDAAEMLSKAIALDPRYSGDKMKFIKDIRNQYIKSGDQDLADYLDIINY